MGLWAEAVRALWKLRAKISRRLAPGKPPHDSYWRAMWAEAADAAGAELTALGDGAFEIRRGDRSVRVKGSLVGLDTQETLDRAGNKPLTHKLLTEAGVATPPYLIYTFADLEAGWAFVQREAPCVVKPSRGTGAAQGVTTGVTTRRAYRRACYAASVHCDELVVEKQLAGDVYRLLYLDGELLDAVRRGCPRVRGDGSSTVRHLIRAENDRRAQENSPSTTRGISIDDDCIAAVQRAGHTLASVLPDRARPRRPGHARGRKARGGGDRRAPGGRRRDLPGSGGRRRRARGQHDAGPPVALPRAQPGTGQQDRDPDPV
jgi:hypothetical protein